MIASVFCMFENVKNSAYWIAGAGAQIFCESHLIYDAKDTKREGPFKVASGETYEVKRSLILDAYEAYGDKCLDILPEKYVVYFLRNYVLF